MAHARENTMLIYIIRHAWAVDSGDPAWPDDFQRPLTDEGKKRFAKMAKFLQKRGFAPEIVATSPLVRCRQTAEIIARGVDGSPKLVELEALRPGSDFREILDWTRREARNAREVAWVGHAPDVSHLAGSLLGAPESAIHFAKGAVAAIAFEDLPEAGRGELQWLVTAKVLGE